MPAELRRELVMWVSGVLAALFGLIQALVTDPTGLGAALIATAWQQAGALFTVTSIAGFTLAPEVPQLPARQLQLAALAFGALFAITLLDRFWDNFEERLR